MHSLQRNFIFIHIPKTGGNEGGVVALRALLERWAGTGHSVPSIQEQKTHGVQVMNTVTGRRGITVLDDRVLLYGDMTPVRKSEEYILCSCALDYYTKAHVPADLESAQSVSKAPCAAIIGDDVVLLRSRLCNKRCDPKIFIPRALPLSRRVDATVPTPAPETAMAPPSVPEARAGEGVKAEPAPRKFFSLDELKAGCPEGVSKTQKEMFLSDDDFQSLFRMKKDAWRTVQGWRKNSLKKQHGLF